MKLGFFRNLGRAYQNAKQKASDVADTYRTLPRRTAEAYYEGRDNAIRSAGYTPPSRKTGFIERFQERLAAGIPEQEPTISEPAHAHADSYGNSVSEAEYQARLAKRQARWAGQSSEKANKRAGRDAGGVMSDSYAKRVLAAKNKKMELSVQEKELRNAEHEYRINKRYGRIKGKSNNRFSDPWSAGGNAFSGNAFSMNSPMDFMNGDPFGMYGPKRRKR